LITNVALATPLKGPAPEAAAATGSEKTQNAAREFESLLLTMMLKTMREASGSEGWLGTGEDQAASSVMELAEQQVAQALAASGGLGLARLAEEGLKQPDPVSSKPISPASRTLDRR
jgi:Rod binding domain-containing protein